MAITIADLTAVPYLKLHFHAGAGGGDRLVTWAHSSDLPNPTGWLAPGDLLMSNGLSLPQEADGQVSFLDELASAGLSGLAMGDDMHAPPLATELLERADDLAFPVLGIPRDVPFAAISRTVANANADEEHTRLVRTAQLYETLRAAVTDDPSRALLVEALAGRLGCRLLLLDVATRLPVLAAEPEPPPGLADALVADLRHRKGVFPAFMRIDYDGPGAVALPVPAERLTALVAVHADERMPDLALLQHAANITAVEVERTNTARERGLRLGSALLAAMVERGIEPASAAQRLWEHGIAADTAVLVAFRPVAPGANQRDLHHELAQRQVPNLVLWSSQRCLVAMPDTDAAQVALRRALGPNVVLGISDPLRRADRAPDARREAGWALAAGRNLRRAQVRYGESAPLFLPRTLGEAEMVADRVLGPIMAYDEAHGTDLLRSLAVFLEENRSWQRTAEVLHVHKQTMVYRMRRVEELTECDLRSTADVVKLWLALRALDLCRGDASSRSAEGGDPHVAA